MQVLTWLQKQPSQQQQYKGGNRGRPETVQEGRIRRADGVTVCHFFPDRGGAARDRKSIFHTIC